MPHKYTQAERTTSFWARVDKTGPCWIWSGSCDRDGYGHFWNGERNVRSHQHSYVMANGPVPDGLEVDHLCRVRGCVRPDHLEAVTHAVNVSRGSRAAQTHCVRGHERTAENTSGTRRRRCKVCDRDRKRAGRSRTGVDTTDSGWLEPPMTAQENRALNRRTQ